MSAAALSRSVAGARPGGLAVEPGGKTGDGRVARRAPRSHRENQSSVLPTWIVSDRAVTLHRWPAVQNCTATTPTG
jgi:hypothetical protein